MSINLMGFGQPADMSNIIDRIYGRFNIEKSLVNVHRVTNIEILGQVLDEQIRGKVEMIKNAKKGNKALTDYLYTGYYVGHARIAKLLYDTPNREIQADTGSDLGRLVISMLEEQEDVPSTRFVGYFNALATKTNDTLTQEILDKRAIDMIETSDFSSSTEFEKRREILQVAYSVLSNIIEKNNGQVENPQELMNVMVKTFFVQDPEAELTDREKEVFSQIRDSKNEATYDFLPKILLAPDDGKINRDTLESRYRNFLELDFMNNNGDTRYRRDVETIYQSLLMSLLERGGEISRAEADTLMNIDKEMTAKVRNQVVVSMLLDEDRTFTAQELEEKFATILGDDTEENKDNIEDTMELKLIYGVLLDSIRRNGGTATTGTLKYAMATSQADLEAFKEYARKENRSPFKVYPIRSEKTPEEMYEEKLSELEKKLNEAIAVGDIQEAHVILATANVYKELIEAANNVDRRREEELVTYEVDATRGKSDGAFEIGLCDVELLRLGVPEEVITMENNVGDTINVTRVGRFGFAAMRKEDGSPLYTDNMSTQEYLITKTYNSRTKEGEKPESKTFRVFSRTLIPADIKQSDEIYSIYANQIFSDLSLEAAEKYNGGLIAAVFPDIIKPDGTNVTEIAFDSNTLSACLELEKRIKEYDRAEATTNIGRRRVKGINNRLVLVGNSNIGLSKGYATRIFLHEAAPEEGEEKKEDVLFAFEWSDEPKKKTLLDIVRNADLRSI